MTILSRNALDFAKECVHAENVDALLITNLDRFLQPCNRDDDWPVKWLTGFDGSAGIVLMTPSEIFLLTDVRYATLAKEMVSEGIRVVDTSKVSLIDIMRQNIPRTGHILVDPWRVSVHFYHEMMRELPQVSVRTGAFPFFQNVAFAPREQTLFWLFNSLGHNFRESYARVREKLLEKEAFFCGDSAALSWLLNLRQPTESFVPAAQIYGLITSKSIFVWCDMACVSDDVRSFLSPLVSFMSLDDFEDTFGALIQNLSVAYAPARTPYAVLQAIQKRKRLTRVTSNPITALQMIKTTQALQYLSYAHEREGLAFVRLFYEIEQSLLGHNLMTEWEVARRLEDIRGACSRYKGPSFPSIAAAGSNAAFMHYHPTKNKTGTLSHGEVFLLDAGGHYLPGATTDTTRTIALGPVHNPRVIKFYTAVLKGLIAHTCAVFPVGTRGVQLEALARSPLWRMGKDYNHATGHGVGSFLNVHEPPTLSSRDDGIALEPFMVVTSEPGYYELGAFGIRLENMMTVVKSAEEDFLTFEPLTLVPFDRTLIDLAQLSDAEIDWINRYHDKVFDALSPLLDEASLQDWLQEKTRPLERTHDRNAEIYGTQ